VGIFYILRRHLWLPASSASFFTFLHPQAFLSSVVHDEAYLSSTWELTPQWNKALRSELGIHFPLWTVRTPLDMHALRCPTWVQPLKFLKTPLFTLVASITMRRLYHPWLPFSRYTEKFICPGYGWIHTMSRRLLRPSGWRAPQARRFGVLVRNKRGISVV